MAVLPPALGDFTIGNRGGHVALVCSVAIGHSVLNARLPTSPNRSLTQGGTVDKAPATDPAHATARTVL